MIQISEAASLALHSMKLLALAEDETLSVEALATRLDASHTHLSKVLQRLSRAGLVAGRRGPGGGYGLTRPSEEITLLEVYEAIDGVVPTSTCLLKHPKCLLGSCMFGDLLRDAARRFEEHLRGQTLADMAAKGD